MRRVHCNPHYGIGKITIAGDDKQIREVPGQLVAMKADFLLLSLMMRATRVRIPLASSYWTSRKTPRPDFPSRGESGLDWS